MSRLLVGLRLVLYSGLVLCLAAFNIVGIRWMESLALENERISKGISAQIVSSINPFEDPMEKEEEAKERKIAYLTFDDGPSENTERILDVLKEKGVKATFFVVGKTGIKAEERYKRIIAEGHTLGLHSYSHRYNEIYASLDQFKEDVRKLSDFLYDITGERSWAYRFPGGSSNNVATVDIRECIDFLKTEGMVHFDWNASSEDAVTTGVSCSILNSNVLKDALRYQYPMILMHDLSVCSNTVDGLPSLIDRLKAEGYEIQAITRETMPVQHVK